MRASCSIGIRDKLSAHRQVENIKFLAKNSASQPAPKDLLEEVAANYKERCSP